MVELDYGTAQQTSSVGETEKKIRNIKKKLRQIATVKEKMQSQGTIVLYYSKIKIAVMAFVVNSIPLLQVQGGSARFRG